MDGREISIGSYLAPTAAKVNCRRWPDASRPLPAIDPPFRHSRAGGKGTRARLGLKSVVLRWRLLPTPIRIPALLSVIPAQAGIDPLLPALRRGNGATARNPGPLSVIPAQAGIHLPPLYYAKATRANRRQTLAPFPAKTLNAPHIVKETRTAAPRGTRRKRLCG